MSIVIEEAMHDETPVLLITGMDLEHPNIEGQRANVSAVIETAIAPPRQDRSAFEQWAMEESLAAIRTRDDRIAARPSIWPDGSEHTVHRVWHLGQRRGEETVSVWSTPAPPVPYRSMPARFSLADIRRTGSGVKEISAESAAFLSAAGGPAVSCGPMMPARLGGGR